MIQQDLCHLRRLKAVREQATVQAKLQGDRGTPTAGCARTGEATGVSWRVMACPVSVGRESFGMFWMCCVTVLLQLRFDSFFPSTNRSWSHHLDAFVL